MEHTIGNIVFGEIKNVRKSGDEEGVYVADVELRGVDERSFTTSTYCARYDDCAITGQWVYEQIVSNNIVGSVTQLPVGVDLVTGLPLQPIQSIAQPISQGAQDL
jgi:hypothetical protein